MKVSRARLDDPLHKKKLSLKFRNGDTQFEHAYRGGKKLQRLGSCHLTMLRSSKKSSEEFIVKFNIENKDIC